MLEWPHPGRFQSGPLTIFGYAGRVLLWTTVTPPADFSGGRRVRLEADVSWLACQDVCIPGEATVSLELDARGETGVPGNGSSFDDAEKRLPASSGAWQARGWYQDDYTLIIELESGGGHRLEGVYFFPYDQGVIDYSRPQELKQLEASGSTGGHRLTIARDRMVGAAPERLRGVIVADSGWGNNGQALELEVPMLSEPR